MRATLPHPAMLIITGDLLAHQFPQTFANTTHDPSRAHYRSFVLKTVQFIALELHKRFPQTTILLTPGNNDDDCGDYAILGGATFLSDTSELMRGLAHGSDTFATDWRALGSYNVANPAVRKRAHHFTEYSFLLPELPRLRFSRGLRGKACR